LVTPKNDLYSWTLGADKAGLHISAHAIGDKAIDTILTIFEEVARINGPKDRRLRIEHAQEMRMIDRPRLKKLDIIASMQPYHLIDDGNWAEKLLGPQRIHDLYAFRSLIDNGTRLAFGSDWFVAPPVPLQGLYSAVTRSTLDGKNPDGWIPEQKITIEEALRAYTADAAYASFEDNIKGMLKQDYLADIVLIDRDITQLHDNHDIWNAKIKGTIVGGKLVYSTL